MSIEKKRTELKEAFPKAASKGAKAAGIPDPARINMQDNDWGVLCEATWDNIPTYRVRAKDEEIQEVNDLEDFFSKTITGWIEKHKHS